MRKKKNKPYNSNDPYIVKWRCTKCKNKGVIGLFGNIPLIKAIKRAFNKHAKNCQIKEIRYSYTRKV